MKEAYTSKNAMRNKNKMIKNGTVSGESSIPSARLNSDLELTPKAE